MSSYTLTATLVVIYSYRNPHRHLLLLQPSSSSNFPVARHRDTALNCVSQRRMVVGCRNKGATPIPQREAIHVHQAPRPRSCGNHESIASAAPVAIPRGPSSGGAVPSPRHAALLAVSSHSLTLCQPPIPDWTTLLLCRRGTAPLPIGSTHATRTLHPPEAPHPRQIWHQEKCRLTNLPYFDPLEYVAQTASHMCIPFMAGLCHSSARRGEVNLWEEAERSSLDTKIRQDDELSPLTTNALFAQVFTDAVQTCCTVHGV